MGDAIDFDTSTTNECVLLRPVGAGSSYVQLTDQVSVSGTYANFIKCEDGATSYIKGFPSGSVSGSVSGTAYELVSRVTALGLGAVSGSLTSAADVQVGNAGTFTYSSLPQNDFTSPAGVGTVVES